MSYIPTITESRIASDAVTSAKIAADAVGSSEIATDAVGSVELAADSVTSAEIAAGAVGASEIADGSITDTEIAAANKDGVAGTPSLRTLGTGAQQALAGNTTLDVIANPVADLDMDGFKITDLGTPTLASDAATKGYVDSVASGFDPKESVLYTTTGNITLSGTGTQANGTWPAALTAGDRILVKNQTALDENGIYAAAAGAWTRTADFDGTPSAEVSTGAFTHVAADDGTSLVGTGWVVTSPDPIVVDTDPIEWTQVTSPGAVSVLNDLLDVITTGVVNKSALVFNGTDWVDTQNVLIDDANSVIEIGGFATVGNDGFGNLELDTTSGNIQFNSAVAANSGLSVSNDFTSVDRTIMQGGQRVRIDSVTDHTVVLADDYVLAVDSSAALRTVTLPASHTAGDSVVVKRIGANNVEVATADADTIDGSASNYVIDVNYMAITLVSDGTNWLVI